MEKRLGKCQLDRLDSGAEFVNIYVLLHTSGWAEQQGNMRSHEGLVSCDTFVIVGREGVSQTNV